MGKLRHRARLGLGHSFVNLPPGEGLQQTVSTQPRRGPEQEPGPRIPKPGQQYPFYRVQGSQPRGGTWQAEKKVQGTLLLPAKAVSSPRACGWARGHPGSRAGPAQCWCISAGSGVRLGPGTGLERGLLCRVTREPMAGWAPRPRAPRWELVFGWLAPGSSTARLAQTPPVPQWAHHSHKLQGCMRRPQGRAGEGGTPLGRTRPCFPQALA